MSKFLAPKNLTVDKSPDAAKDILNMVIRSDVNDYYISIGQKPFIRRQGFFSEVSDAPEIDNEKLDAILEFLLGKKRYEEAIASIANKQAYHFSGSLSAELDGVERACRYRAILVSSLNGPELTVRVLDRNLLELNTLGLAQEHYEHVIETLQKGRGLILVTGPTGAGKSTTLAAMIQHLINNYPFHVVTLEDPVEFLYKPSLAEGHHAFSMVTQRSVNVDCGSYQQGLMDALRMKPEVIAIGEIRDAATMRTVIDAAETGHLIIGTMHASTVHQAIDRIVSQAGSDARLMRQMLSKNLRCVIAQNLLTTADSTEENPKRVLCYEALFRTKDVQAAISKDAEITQASLNDLIRESGGITWDDCLDGLVKDGFVSEAEAITHKVAD